MKYPKVSVIIINWNGKRFLKDCLDSVLNQTYPNYEIILVDNGSIDGSVEFVEKNYPEVKLIKNEKNLGFAEGNNVGIRKALKNPKIEYVALLNNDMRVDQKWLESLVDAQADIAQSQILTSDGKISATGILYSRNGLAFDRRSTHYDKEPFGASGGAVLYKGEVLEDVGVNTEFFDKDFFCYSEDVDFSFRARLRGWKVKYAPQSIVYHKGSMTAGRESKFGIYFNHRNNVWVIVKNMPTKLLFKYFWKILLAQAGFVFLHLLRGHGIILKAKIDAIIQIPRMLKKREIIQKGRTISGKELDTRFVDKWVVG